MFAKLLCFLVILGVAFGKAKPAGRSLEDDTRRILECFNQALDGGLPEADIPNHNPLEIWRNISIPIDLAGITGTISLDGLVMRDITHFDVTDIVATTPETNELDLAITFEGKQISLEGNWHANVTGLEQHVLDGTIKVTLHDVVADLTWDQTLTTDDALAVLLKSVVDVKCSSAEVEFHGIDFLTDALVSSVASTTLTTLINTQFPAEQVGDFLTGLVNEKWYTESGAARITAVLENCQQ